MPQLSDAVADPSAAFISEGTGLHSSGNVADKIATGRVKSIESVAASENVTRPVQVSLITT